MSTRIDVRRSMALFSGATYRVQHAAVEDRVYEYAMRSGIIFNIMLKNLAPSRPGLVDANHRGTQPNSVDGFQLPREHMLSYLRLGRLEADRYLIFR